MVTGVIEELNTAEKTVDFQERHEASVLFSLSLEAGIT